MKHKSPNYDREQLKRCKYASTESKLDWLWAAIEFVREAQRSNKMKKVRRTH